MVDKKSKYDKRYIAAVDAAAAVFADKGYHGASTIDIANRLDIKQGSLYYYFPSKEAALEAVCLEGIKYQTAYLESLLETDQSFADRILAIFNHTLISLQDRAAYMIVFNDERQFIPIERRGNIRSQSHFYHKRLEQLFARAQQRGEMNPHLDVYISVRAFTGLLTSISSWYRSKQDVDIDVEMVAEHYSEIFLRGSSVKVASQ